MTQSNETLEGAKLTREQRKNMPKKYFGVPGKEALPMPDVSHTKMAWNMLPKTQGLTPEEVSTAKKRILRRAHELGVDTKNWKGVSAEDLEYQNIEGWEDTPEDVEDDNIDQWEDKKISNCVMAFSAMAIELPDVVDHPNRIPFKGVLTKLDEPSDSPLGGSNGKRVILPKYVAEQAIASILGMAIDFKQDLSGHDAQQKIGIITEAFIDGNQIPISGFFYGADFPDVIKRIQAEKTLLGFSYEAQVQIQSMDDDPLRITHCVFTGAAVLYKDKAAYKSTSLTANADEENFMTKEVLEALDKLNQRLDKLEAGAFQASGLYAMVKPHADALHAAANEMCAAGIGTHPEHGHAAVVRAAANHMMSEASAGRMPHVYQTNDWLQAGSEKKEKLSASADEKALQTEIDSLKTEIANLKKANFNASEQPDRKTATTNSNGTVITKVSAGNQSPLKSFDDFYKEAEAKGITDPAMKTTYALQAHGKQIQETK